MDLTQWFCWITGAGAIIGLISALQQILLHGMHAFVRAVAVALAIGSALALVYPNIQLHNASGGSRVALAVSATPAESTPQPRPPICPTTVGPIFAPVAAGLAESTFGQPTPVDSAPQVLPPLASATAGLAPLPLESDTPESALAEPTSFNSATVNSTADNSPNKLARSTPLEPLPIEPLPADFVPMKPAPLQATSGSRTPSHAGTVQLGHGESKPAAPTLLPKQQKLFWPSEVAYCPICSMAYSSKGPTVDVKCPYCAGKVNLVSNHDYMVHRCGKCGTLYRTTHFPPAIVPYLFRYYCSFCQESHWYPN